MALVSLYIKLEIKFVSALSITAMECITKIALSIMLNCYVLFVCSLIFLGYVSGNSIFISKIHRHFEIRKLVNLYFKRN